MAERHQRDGVTAEVFFVPRAGRISTYSAGVEEKFVRGAVSLLRSRPIFTIFGEGGAIDAGLLRARRRGAMLGTSFDGAAR